MGIFPIEAEAALALAAGLAFSLGWLSHRWLHARREQHAIERLSQKISKLDQQRDAAHRVALDLAARQAKLRAYQEAEMKFRSLKSAPGPGFIRHDKVVEGYDVHVSEMTEASWPALEIAQ